MIFSIFVFAQHTFQGKQLCYHVFRVLKQTVSQSNDQIAIDFREVEKRADFLSIKTLIKVLLISIYFF